MKQTRLIMGMPITVEVLGCDSRALDEVFDYFHQVDVRYSPFKEDSELSKINQGLPKKDWSQEMRQVIALCEETKRISGGYFDIRHQGRIDTSGLVKGWAINNAANLLHQRGYGDFYIEAGGDIQVSGNNAEQSAWAIGIRNPFQQHEIVKVVLASNDEGVATSGTYLLGDHIYDPVGDRPANPLCSLTVIGPNIYEADRMATAAFAMGRDGLMFIESLDGFEAYAIDNTKTATYTKGFANYVADYAETSR